MRTVQVNLYTYDELSDAAKAKAREWYAACDAFDPEMEPYETAARILGITFATGRNNTSDIQWSGFSSQGDGASFVGSYSYSPKAAQAIREEFPEDNMLHRIADTLAVTQARYTAPLAAKIGLWGRYVQSRSMWLEDYSPEDLTNEDLNDGLLLAMRLFADWIYICLEDDYNSQREDEYIEESILSNGYEFRADGERSNG